MPDMPGSPQPVATAKGGSGLPENVAGALSYLLGPLTGIAFFLIDRERAFVRFHAVQSIAVTIAWVAIAVALMIVSTVIGVIPVLGFLVSILLNLGLAVVGFGLWIFLMLQAYRGETWALPVLGPHVRRLAAETGGAPQG
jgi:uncharacterized membrane protein